MKRTVLALSFLSMTSLVGGCAAIDGNFVGGSKATTAASASKELAYEPMGSLPPNPQKEDVPSLSQHEVWVPGYYQPVAGTWLWHQGQVQQQKDGYRLVPASYKEQDGKVVFSPPRWRRADLADKK
jgi:hypothetical protein